MYRLSQVLQTFATAERPLVICLDDIQWLADELPLYVLPLPLSEQRGLTFPLYDLSAGKRSSLRPSTVSSMSLSLLATGPKRLKVKTTFDLPTSRSSACPP